VPGGASERGPFIPCDPIRYRRVLRVRLPIVRFKAKALGTTPRRGRSSRSLTRVAETRIRPSDSTGQAHCNCGLLNLQHRAVPLVFDFRMDGQSASRWCYGVSSSVFGKGDAIYRLAAFQDAQIISPARQRRWFQALRTVGL